MELEGKIWKSKKFWLVEVPSLDIMTQGCNYQGILVKSPWQSLDTWKQF